MLFSIVVPVYNVEKYIKKCVESLKKQSFDDFEVVFVNDGSTDNSINILSSLIKNIPNFRIINQKNEGLSSARNTGIAYSKGDFIVFLDSDDYVSNDILKIISDSLSKIDYKCDVIAYGYKEINEENVREINHISEGYCETKQFMKNELRNHSLYMAAWAYAYRKEFLYNNDLYFKKGILHEDEEFTPRALIKSKYIFSINKTLYNYKLRENSITTKKNKDKNAIDLYDTLNELSYYYSQLEDYSLRLLLENSLVEKYLFMFTMNMNDSVRKHITDKKFLINKKKNIKSQIKSCLFLLNPSLYLLIHRISK